MGVNQMESMLLEIFLADIKNRIKNADIGGAIERLDGAIAALDKNRVQEFPLKRLEMKMCRCLSPRFTTDDVCEECGLPRLSEPIENLVVVKKG